ncbi:MAG: peroxiredoxin family protein [Candidatus Omnitrophota bacterium]
MRNYLRALFIFGLVSIFNIPCAQAQEPAPATRNIAPDFKLEDLSQQAFTLSSYKHKQPVVLFFWTTWCPYCRKELRELRDIYPQLAKEGWELFAVNVGESPYKVSKVVKDIALNFKVLLDKDGAAADSYDVLGVPTYFIVDKQGRVVFNGHSFPKGTYRQLAP